MRVYLIIVSAKKIIVSAGFFVLIGFFVMPVMALDRFMNNGDGTVTDTKTGLMWAAKDNGSPINWQNAPFLLPKLQRWRLCRLADAHTGRTRKSL